MKNRKTLNGPGNIHLVLDRSEVFPDNPGNGTPALVYDAFWKHSATYDCAVGTGELECGEVLLTPEQVDWLAAQEGEVVEFLGE